MAEKYGTVPPRFTKDWWDYFWMYYKGYVITFVFAIIVTAVTIYQVVTKPHYDITIMYAGSYAFSDEEHSAIDEAIAPLCEDIDENGEKLLYFSELTFSEDDLEYNAAMSQKLYLTIAADDVYIYLLEPDLAASFIDSPEESAFIPLSKWADKDFPEDKVFALDGTAFGVAIDEIEVFREISEKSNKDLSKTYLFVRYAPRDDQKEQNPGYEAALKTVDRLFNK